MRLFQNEHVFLNDWGSITAAFWVKYPNELQPHVLRVDTLDLHIDEEKQQFVCRRLLSLKYQCPKWVQKFFGASPVGFAIEEATCSLKERKLTLSCFTGCRTCANSDARSLEVQIHMTAAVAQAKEKSLLGVSVVERMGCFVAEQKWLRCCSNCLQSLEEAAADASKQAQEKYRRLKQCVEQKLGVAAIVAADVEQGDGEYPRVVATAESAGGAARRLSGTGTTLLASRAFPSKKKDMSDSSAQAIRIPNDLFLAAKAVPRGSFASQASQSGAEGGADSQCQSAPPSETEAKADCPCRQPTAAGRLPAPTSVWSNMRKQALEKAALFHPVVNLPSTASLTAAPRSGTLDLAFVGREVAGAAQCQQQQQDRHEAAWGWRGNAFFSVERPEAAQEDAARRRRSASLGSALLLSSLVGGTGEAQ
ncbi:hypothetical protein Esti_005158 [Eimeria stiedai]